jgi:cellulose synthase/poly-beta-1,6-N-acetylglucosamine synthase-like glycosyltransferase
VAEGRTMGRTGHTGVLVTMKPRIKLLCSTHQAANRHAPWWLLLGMVAVVAWNWRLWKRDQAQASRDRGRFPPLPKLTRTPKVSVLVAAWNEQHRIEDHLRSFLRLSYPNIELVLCAGGEDSTLDIARRYACERMVVLEQQPGEGKQRSLARCLTHASGEIIYLTDADGIYTDEALVRLLTPLIEEGEQVVTGGIRPLDEQLDKVLPRYFWASDTVASFRSPPYGKGVRGANTALTRQALDQSGGLDFDAPTGTDYQLALRLLACGFAIRQVPTSVVPVEYEETLRGHRRRQSRWLRNLLIYGYRRGARDDVLVTLRTVGVGTTMVLLPLTAVVGGRSVLVPWLLLVGHAAAAKLRYVFFTAQLYQQPVPWRLLLSIVPLTLIDFGIWASTLFDLLKASRRYQW